MKNKIVIAVAVLLVVFFAGFLPAYVKVRRLEGELREARRINNSAELRDLASLTYFHASRKDYGLAAGASTHFFDRAREAAKQAPDAETRKPFEKMMSLQDPITAALAKGDAAVLGDLQNLFEMTRDAPTAPSVVRRNE